MKTWKKKTVTKEETFLEKMNCDLCGSVVLKEDWSTGRFDTEETVISMKQGSSYPEGASGVETTFDICPDCFETKLIPWLEDQGAEAQKREYDW